MFNCLRNILIWYINSNILHCYRSLKNLRLSILRFIMQIRLLIWQITFINCSLSTQLIFCKFLYFLLLQYLLWALRWNKYSFSVKWAWQRIIIIISILLLRQVIKQSIFNFFVSLLNLCPSIMCLRWWLVHSLIFFKIVNSKCFFGNLLFLWKSMMTVFEGINLWVLLIWKVTKQH